MNDKKEEKRNGGGGSAIFYFPEDCSGWVLWKQGKGEKKGKEGNGGVDSSSI